MATVKSGPAADTGKTDAPTTDPKPDGDGKTAAPTTGAKAPAKAPAKRKAKPKGRRTSADAKNETDAASGAPKTAADDAPPAEPTNPPPVQVSPGVAVATPPGRATATPEFDPMAPGSPGTSGAYSVGMRPGFGASLAFPHDGRSHVVYAGQAVNLSAAALDSLAKFAKSNGMDMEAMFNVVKNTA